MGGRKPKQLHCNGFTVQARLMRYRALASDVSAWARSWFMRFGYAAAILHHFCPPGARPSSDKWGCWVLEQKPRPLHIFMSLIESHSSMLPNNNFVRLRQRWPYMHWSIRLTCVKGCSTSATISGIHHIRLVSGCSSIHGSFWLFRSVLRRSVATRHE